MPDRFTFYLGCSMPHWLRDSTVPLFVSYARLRRYKTLPKAKTRWALDSSAFSEIAKHGKWTITEEEYIAAVRRYKNEIGKLDWCAPQDLMCEPQMLKKTGLTVQEHQRRTVANLIKLRTLAPDLRDIFIPVLQGWTLKDYLYCVKLYEAAGIDLTKERIVGLGSVCRRQNTDEIGEIVRTLYDMGISLHGFGCKAGGVRKYGQYLASSDSMAWSLQGRYVTPCAHGKAKSESNCRTYAMDWRSRLMKI